MITIAIADESRADKTEFESILKNEQSDMKGNRKVEASNSGLFPVIGPINNVYIFIKLVFQIITAFIFTFRLAFLQEIEYWPFVYLDFVTDFFFLIDMIITFNLPVIEKSKMVTDRAIIAKAYLKLWFWFDFYNLFPFSFFRMKSMNNPRNPNNLQNFLTLNFKSLPRFYPMLVIIKLTRLRGLDTNLQKMLKKIIINPHVQAIIADLFWMLFVMHICGCFLMAGAYFNLYTQ